MANAKQESRTERITVACTPSEKRAAEIVAAIRQVDGVSSLLRTMSLDEIVAEYHRAMARLREGVDDPKMRAVDADRAVAQMA